MRLNRSAAAAALLCLLAACGGGGAEEDAGPLACLALPAEVSIEAAAETSSEWKDVLVDAGGQVWIAGYERGRLGEASVDPSGDARGVVRLLSRRGEAMFDSAGRLDGTGADVAEALAIDASGVVTVAGRTTGVLAGTVNRGQFDLVVARLPAAQPAAPWRLAQFGDERPQRPRRVATDGTSTLLVAGHDDDYIPSNYVAAWADTFATRLELEGPGAGAPVAQAWKHQSNSTEQDFASALAVQQDHVFIGGAVTAGPQRGMFVRKLSAAGAPIWTARYSGIGADHVAALRSLPDGSLLMAGSVSGSFRGGTNRGQQDVFVARISPVDGTVLWSAQVGSAGSDWLTDMEVDAQGNVLLYGETDGSFVEGRASDGSIELFLLALRPDGSLRRAWQWGTAADEMATGLALDRCGRAVAVGSTGTATRRRAVLWFPQGQ